MCGGEGGQSDSVQRRFLCVARYNFQCMLRWAIRLTSQHQKGERKQTWNAWKPQRVKQEREEQRAALTAKKDALKEVMMLLDEIGPRTDYREAASMLRYE